MHPFLPGVDAGLSVGCDVLLVQEKEQRQEQKLGTSEFILSELLEKEKKSCG